MFPPSDGMKPKKTNVLRCDAARRKLGHPTNLNPKVFDFILHTGFNENGCVDALRGPREEETPSLHESVPGQSCNIHP